MLAARLGFRAAARGATRRIPQIRTVQRPLLRSQQKRFASYNYQRFDGQGGKQSWSNFGPAYRVQYIWRNYQTPILITGAAGGTIYVVNLEEVPITHRRRFNIISPETEKQIMAGGYEQVLDQFRGKILPANHPYTRQVARVVERLLPSTGGLAGDDWAVHVIDEPGEKNAFVMPGGKVFVFSGILPIAQDEDGLAAVLGHEIAHNVAHHAAERLSRSGFLAIFAFLGAYLFDVSGSMSQMVVDLLLSLPNSRTQEAEADHIGLLIMAESCYNPEAAVEMWRRMAQSEKGSPPQFMSTHPSSYNRMDTIRGWLPEARAKYEESQCGMTRSFARDFKQAFSSNGSLQTTPQQQRPQKDDDDFF